MNTPRAGGPENLLATLRQMWEEHDPMPPGLPDQVLLAVALHDLDVDAELLMLVGRHASLAGVRGVEGAGADVSEPVVYEFASPAVSVLVRVCDSPGGRRVDGWVTPAGFTSATVRSTARNRVCEVSPDGRFELVRASGGPASLTLTGHADLPPVTTPVFDI